MINGVLVERTVKDVMPQLTTNADGLKKVLDDLLKQYTSKQEELEKWKVSLCFFLSPSLVVPMANVLCQKRNKIQVVQQ